MAGFEIQRVESKFFDLDDIIAKSDSTSCTFEIGDLNPGLKSHRKPKNSSDFCSDFFQEMLGVSKPTQNADGYGVDAPYWLLESVRSSFSVRI